MNEVKKPKYPKTLSALFTTKYIPCNPPALLDYPRTELLFIPSHAHPTPELEETASKEEKGFEKLGVQAALEELGIAKYAELGPLEGHWA